jgi:hypothetical protein
MADQQTKFNTSFIPKKQVATPQSKPLSRKKGPSLFSIIGLFIFLGSIIALAGVYGWKYQTENVIDSQIQQLEAARSEFNEQTIKEATRLNERIIAVEDLLSNHVAPSNIFSILENITLQSVRYNSLSYTTGEDGEIKISGTGSAVAPNSQQSGFESVVLQSDEFGKTGNFRDVLFSGVQTTQDGTSVSFTLDASIEEELMLFKNRKVNNFEDVEVGDSASSRKTLIKDIFN